MQVNIAMSSESEHSRAVSRGVRVEVGTGPSRAAGGPGKPFSSLVAVVRSSLIYITTSFRRRRRSRRRRRQVGGVEVIWGLGSVLSRLGRRHVEGT